MFSGEFSQGTRLFGWWFLAIFSAFFSYRSGIMIPNDWMVTMNDNGFPIPEITEIYDGLPQVACCGSGNSGGDESRCRFWFLLGYARKYSHLQKDRIPIPSGYLT